MFTLQTLRRALFGALLAAPLAVGAQSFPERAVKLIVPYAPGGSADIAARLVSDEWAKVLGQLVVIENRSGEGGNIGVDVVAKSKADG